MLPDARKQRLAYLLFHCGLSLRDVLLNCPQEFDDLREISRLRHDILEQLLHNADQFRWRLTAGGNSEQGNDERRQGSWGGEIK
jgi:hypothetical protein